MVWTASAPHARDMAHPEYKGVDGLESLGERWEHGMAGGCVTIGALGPRTEYVLLVRVGHRLRCTDTVACLLRSSSASPGTWPSVLMGRMAEATSADNVLLGTKRRDYQTATTVLEQVVGACTAEHGSVGPAGPCRRVYQGVGMEALRLRPGRLEELRLRLDQPTAAREGNGPETASTRYRRGCCSAEKNVVSTDATSTGAARDGDASPSHSIRGWMHLQRPTRGPVAPCWRSPKQRQRSIHKQTVRQKEAGPDRRPISQEIARR